MNDESCSSKSSPPLAAHLPLDWTTIKRRRKRQKTTCTIVGGDENNINNTETDNVWFCCEDPSCTNTNEEMSYKHKFGKNRKSSSSSKSKMTSLKGKGIFCLHSLDCTWFQGHFIPSRMNSSSFGLLAVQREDVNECLQCKDGGYREIDLTILSASKKENTGSSVSKSSQEDEGNLNVNGSESSNNEKERKKENIVTVTKRRKLKLEKLQCTGGDMLRITTTNNSNGSDDLETDAALSNGFALGDSPDSVENENTNAEISFDAERIITGRRVKPLVQKYFASLVSSISSSSSIADSDSLSDFLPDCAIVIGEMCIRVPSEFVYGHANEARNDNNDNGVDDDWLE